MIGIYYNVGEFERSDGNLDKAVEYWEKAVEIDNRLVVNNPDARRARRQLDIFKID